MMYRGESYRKKRESHFLLISNILISVSAVSLSIYSNYYSWRLYKVLETTSFKQKLRTKVIVQAMTIQTILVFSVAYNWLRTLIKQSDWREHPWAWPLFQVLYTYFSEIQPFIFFIYILYK